MVLNLKSYEDEMDGDIKNLSAEKQKLYIELKESFDDLMIDRKQVEKDLADGKEVFVIAVDIDMPCQIQREANWHKTDLTPEGAGFALLHEINAHLKNLLKGGLRDLETGKKEHREYYNIPDVKGPENDKWYKVIAEGSSPKTSDIKPDSQAGKDLEKSRAAYQKVLEIIKNEQGKTNEQKK